MDRVPVVDVSAFTSSGDHAAKQATAKELADKVKPNGWVGIKGHGISGATLEKALSHVRGLYNLPYEDKMKAPHPPSGTPHRGYTGLGGERGDAKTVIEANDDSANDAEPVGDYKESFEIGSEGNPSDHNIWLPEGILPGFREFMLQFYWEVNQLCRHLIDAFALSLSLSEKETEAVRNLHTKHDDQLRLLHYPAVPYDKVDKTTRIGMHTDFSIFTLLFQDHNSGLEFKDIKSGEYVSATPQEGVAYLNVGDMLQRISNGSYPSAPHRVVAPKQMDRANTPERYSLAYFVAPKADGIVEPQASLVAEHGKQEYEPVTFMQYVQRIFEGIQTKK